MSKIKLLGYWFYDQFIYPIFARNSDEKPGNANDDPHIPHGNSRRMDEDQDGEGDP